MAGIKWDFTFSKRRSRESFYIPWTGCQKQGMGKDLYEKFPVARDLFDRADDFLGWKITDVMFRGSEEELMQTKNTQPSVFYMKSLWLFPNRM